MDVSLLLNLSNSICYAVGIDGENWYFSGTNYMHDSFYQFLT